MVPEIALAASAREWPDRLHRFVLDHGGGRIVGRVMGPDQAVEDRFDVLLIDDICSYLTPLLVLRIKASGADVIGVFAPEDGSDAKRRLLECGISDVIETEASPEEFLERIGQCLTHRAAPVPEPESTSTVTVAVTGPCEGVGMTEVAVALADALVADVATVLIDMDASWPSVAQRLDLPLHPNIRTALDRTFHAPERLDEALQDFGELAVVGGRADGGRGGPISRHESNALIEALGETFEVVVADMGPLGAIEGGMLREFDSVIVVGSPDPVGVARLIQTVDAFSGAKTDQSVLAVVNQVGRGSFQRSEVVNEVATALPDLSVTSLPYDKAVAAAAWNGEVGSGSRFRRAIGAVSEVLARSVA